MPIVLRRGLTVGATSAEDDERFLTDCFVETGQAEQILDMTSARCIALGRTGSGKSALLFHVRATEEHSASLDPEGLSLNYISNSDILRFFNDLDIDLELFYELLWRHVLIIELLKLKKEFHDQASAKRWYAAIYNSLNNNPRRRAALEYLERYGNSFWLDTEKRVREVVDKIEGALETSVGASVSDLRAKIGANFSKKDAKSHQETSDIINRANRVVSEVQIQELNELMSFLAEDIFKDRKVDYYLLIDDLDRGWVHDSLRFKLTRALIETIRKFRRIRNVKIVVSLSVGGIHVARRIPQVVFTGIERAPGGMLRRMRRRGDQPASKTVPNPCRIASPRTKRVFPSLNPRQIAAYVNQVPG